MGVPRPNVNTRSMEDVSRALQRIQLLLDQLDSTVAGQGASRLSVETGSYSGGQTDLQAVIEDIDSRLTALEP